MNGPARGEIEDLVYSYAERLDTGDLSGVAELFAHATITVEGFDHVARGRDEVFEMYASGARLYPDQGTPKTKHLMTNLIVSVDEAADQASCRSYFTVLQAVSGRLPLQPIIAGRYRSEFERVGGSWRFRTMHIIWDLVGDLSAHLIDSEE